MKRLLHFFPYFIMDIFCQNILHQNLSRFQTRAWNSPMGNAECQTKHFGTYWPLEHSNPVHFPLDRDLNMVGVKS